MDISFTALETYVADHVASVEDSIKETVKAEFDKLLVMIKNEEATIKDEIAHLLSRGYSVQPPQPTGAQPPTV